ncbi:MAG: S8 family peptidase [Flavobacteriales bacterium]|nr:S8 family peptidase [Flavobacteriales bacterium]
MVRIYLLLLVTLLTFHGSAQQRGVDHKLSAYLKDCPDQKEIHLFVKGDKARLESFFKENEGSIKYASGPYWAIRIPASSLRKLMHTTICSNYHFDNYKPVVMNDTMRVKNNIDSVYLGFQPLGTPYTGKSVLTAIIDTGIDFNHPDFKDSTGQTRIVAIWDQTAVFDPQRTPPQYGYGQVWDSSTINQGICTQVDNYAHGSTVAGCTAGNGLATGHHRGVAPEATIIGVKSDLNSSNWLAIMADAVDWIFHMADSLNMPVVINASLGVYEGSHDGKDPAAVYIDSLIRAKRGRLMVCAAGNSGNSALYGNYHLHSEVTSGDTAFTWFQYNPSTYLGYGAVFFEAWSDTSSLNHMMFSVGADATSPQFSFRGNTPFRSVDQIPLTGLTDTLRNGANTLAIVDYYKEEMNGVYLLQVHLKQPDSSQYNFRFITTGDGSYDVWSATWLGTSAILNTGIPSNTQLPDIIHYRMPDSASVIVSSFTCLSSVVTVANYNSTNAYWDYNGNLQTFPTVTGAISVNSSRGPTRDFRQKPEIAATGDVTMSAGPLTSMAWMRINEPFKVSQDTMHIRNGGTSMASPVVAGVGALLLEKCPQLNWDEFAAIISGTANSDAFTGNIPNSTWGFGKINGFRALIETNFQVEIVADTFLCNGDSVLVSTNGNYSTYDWSNGGNQSQFFQMDTDTLQVTVTNMAACKSTDSLFIITEAQALAAPLINGSTSFCYGDSTLLICNENYPIFNWSTGSDSSSTFASASGIISLSAIDVNGCESPVSTINLVELPLTTTSYTYNGNSDSLCFYYGAPYVSLEWYIDNGSGFTLFSATDSACYFPNGDFDLYLVVTDTNHCSAYSDTSHFQISGLEDESSSLLVSIFPNPFHDQLSIRAEAGLKIEMINQLGQIVYTFKIPASGNYSFYPELAPGIYYLRITSATETKCLPIIRQ